MSLKEELTLLSDGQIWGNKNESQLDVFKKYGTKAAVTDLCILTDCIFENKFCIDEDKTFTGRTGLFWTRSDNGSNDVAMVNGHGNIDSIYRNYRACNVRPVLKSPVVFSLVYPNRTKGYNDVEEIEFGEYPQYAPDIKVQRMLEKKYQKCLLQKTGKYYTFDRTKCDNSSQSFQPIKYEEYTHDGKKYIRYRVNNDYYHRCFILSNGVEYRNDDYVWIEVSPVKWLIDEKTRLLISKKGLVSGIRFLDGKVCYKGDFSKTDMKEYLDKYMLRELTQNVELTQDMDLGEKEQFEKVRNQAEKRRNSYNFNLDTVSEEEIIKGAIESDIAVFLHGPSSEGKSARVKQIDATCEIIYLRNASPESLNGKSVYNQATGEMIDIKPSWLKKVEEKCKNEPDKLHIVFFDEITNALPSIQGIAFNIVLDKEVNGIWRLPANARIVAAGNDMKDSLAANQIAEPLFNRFAHVYIKTTTESWLKWASENNIHPAIYSYIAYKNGETLRSKYNGETPNADPRKWEMASKMLYATGAPEMLRALVGEDITKEFIEFCNQLVITLEDVLNDNYFEEEIQVLNTAEKYATIMGLTQVDEANLEKVRAFVIKLGAEFGAIFDALWTHGDEKKLERLAEAKLAEIPLKGIRR